MRSSISHGSLICLVMRVQNRDCVSSGTIQKIREMLEKKNFPWQKVTAFVPTDIQYIWDTWFEKASFGTKGSPNDEGLRKIAEDKSNLCAFKFNDEFYCKVNFVLSEKKARMRKKEFKKIIQMAIGMASLHRASLDAKKTKHQFYCASMCIENRQQSWKRIQHINVFPSSVRLSRRDAQPSIKSTTVHRTLLGAPSDVSLSMALHWCRPEFSAVDGICLLYTSRCV